MVGRKPMLFAIKGQVMTAKQIAQDCQCSIATVHNFWKENRGTDDEKFLKLKKTVQAHSFKPGYVTLLQIAQKSHINRATVYNFSKSKRGKLFNTEVRKDNKRTQPQVMVKLAELENFIIELKRYVHDSEERRSKCEENKAKIEAEKRKSLEELKKEHPLVTDERFFEESYFPSLSLPYTYEPENYRE